MHYIIEVAVAVPQALDHEQRCELADEVKRALHSAADPRFLGDAVRLVTVREVE